MRLHSLSCLPPRFICARPHLSFPHKKVSSVQPHAGGLPHHRGGDLGVGQLTGPQEEPAKIRRVLALAPTFGPALALPIVLVATVVLLPLFAKSAVYYEMVRLPGLQSGCCDMTGALPLSLRTLSMSHGPSFLFVGGLMWSGTPCWAARSGCHDMMAACFKRVLFLSYSSLYPENEH
jgi:hypothetical protein